MNYLLSCRNSGSYPSLRTRNDVSFLNYLDSWAGGYQKSLYYVNGQSVDIGWQNNKLFSQGGSLQICFGITPGTLS